MLSKKESRQRRVNEGVVTVIFPVKERVFFLYMYYGIWQKNRSDEPHESDERHVMTKFDKRQLPL